MLSIILIICTGGIWIVLLMVRSLRLQYPSVTAFELQRRLQAGDHQAAQLSMLIECLPRLRALRWFVSLLLLLLIDLLLCALVGYSWAFALTLLLGLGSEMSAPACAKLTQKLFNHYQLSLLRLTQALSPPLRLLASRHQRHNQPAFYSKNELEHYISKDTTILSAEDKKLLTHALSFGEKKVKSVMTARDHIQTVKAADTLGPVTLDRLHKTGHSRFPVVKNDLNSIVGTLYLPDLVPLNPKLKHIADAMKPQILYVNQDQTLMHVLHAFLRTKHHLFIVVDEFQEVVGLLTIEDVIAQILGRKIIDEFDDYDNLRAVAALSQSISRGEKA